ncbi:hypothetical protein [Actinomadura alba]|uniref:Uncharacterized protein n=1 Tax=Actinomadura alba TaxID=406431 RepID=A0ABR7LP66_9ACTN|nr:hypothetical protein [Actinomadura alba]MBC6466530.1 hypothetical protein [Actinomadura alba]
MSGDHENALRCTTAGVAALVAVAATHTAAQPEPGSTTALLAGYRLGLLVSAGIAAGALGMLAFGRRARNAIPSPG